MAALPTPNIAHLTELPTGVMECRLLLCTLWICCPNIGKNLSWHIGEEHGDKTSAVPYSCSRAQTSLAYFLLWGCLYHGILAGVAVTVVPWAWSHWWDIAIGSHWGSHLARHVWPPEDLIEWNMWEQIFSCCICAEGGEVVLMYSESMAASSMQLSLRLRRALGTWVFLPNFSGFQLNISVFAECCCWNTELYGFLLFCRSPEAHLLFLIQILFLLTLLKTWSCCIQQWHPVLGSEMARNGSFHLRIIWHWQPQTSCSS